MRYLFVCLFVGYVSGKICFFVLEFLYGFVVFFVVKFINDLNFVVDRFVFYFLVLSMFVLIDFFFFFKFCCIEMICFEILLIFFGFLFLFNFLGEMFYVVDVLVIIMIE